MSTRHDALSRSDGGPNLTRRQFVQGIAAAGVVAAFDGSAFADGPLSESSMLTGDRFDLTVASLPVNITGKHSAATAVNGSLPAPTLRWREGDTVTLAVTNRLNEPTSIHWHGIRDAADMDGVPGLSFAGIAPNETFTYRIPVVQNGTYWYHSHSRFQEQTGLYGALIIDPRDADPIESDRDYVILLTDWTDTNPATVYGNLKKQNDYYNYQKRTAGTFFSNVKSQGFHATVSNRLAWGRMNMSPTDLADVTSATYTYLLNGKPPAANWTALFEPGQRVRLRFINGSSMTFFDVRIPGLTMTVVAADGNAVQPVPVDEFRIGLAETYDIIVQPHDDRAYTIFAQPISRGGFARGTLAPRPGMTAEIPALDPLPTRTMADMGMDMSKMKGMQGVEGMNMSGMKSMDMSTTPGMQHDSMPSMKRDTPADANTHEMAMSPIRTVAITNAEKFGTQPFPQPGPNTTRFVPASSDAPQPKIEASHLTIGPSVGSIAASPTDKLSDPGVGLNDNGRRVLSYADLRALYPGVDGRPPTRQIELHLTGNMERYIWGFDGYRFSEAEPVHLELGERVRIVLINDTMMEHPIHLHGLWGELENGQGEYRPFKHTITVKPAERLSYLVSADTPGRWAYHCHLLYHMTAGMFRVLVVS